MKTYTVKFTDRQAVIIEEIARGFRCKPEEVIATLTCSGLEGGGWEDTEDFLIEMRYFIDDGNPPQGTAKELGLDIPDGPPRLYPA